MKKIVSMLLAVMLLSALGVCALADGAPAGDGYVLMNIPYEKFYEAEVSEGLAPDAVSSATLMKTRTAGLAGGSYHVDPEGTDITGVIFPVYVEDMSVLPALGGVEITEDSTLSVTVTNKGEETTTEFTGSGALFEAPSYSWYVLEEAPAIYKTLTAGEEPSFGAVNAEAEPVEATASFVYDRHADMVIRVEGLDELLENTEVSGIVLAADNGARVGLAHIGNIWRKTALGFGLDSGVYEALKGARITEIEYITQGGVYAVETDLAVADDELLPRLNATYIELFPEFVKEDYYDYWMECIGAYETDPAMAELYYQMLTVTYMGELKGEEAIEAYGEDPMSMMFDCFFENGLAKITVNGDVISGIDADGAEVFRHAYHYEDDLPVTFFGEDMGVSLRVYKTDDEDAGLFTYFAFSDDNMAETQHIEFRYGEHIEDLANYSEGEFAYWMASGIADGYKDSVIEACIKLFVDENLGAGEAAEEVSENGILPAIAGENGTTYGNLFDIILSDECYPIWYDYCAAVVGEENAAQTVDFLQGYISSDLYGEAAIEAFGDGSDGMAFDCFYINDVDTFTFEGDTITTTLKDGSSETHTYEYLGSYEIGAGESMVYYGQEISVAFPCDVYKSTDEAGEFNYFFLRDDTMEETYHIEFRYGKDLEELQGYFVGPYAYWLSAGFDVDADEQTLKNVISLFCLENMDYSGHTDAALAQIEELGIVGDWVADLSMFGDEFAGIDLSMSIDENGHGVTVMNEMQTADFEAYAYDNGEAGDGEGLYVAYSNFEGDAEAAPYILGETEDGAMTLTLVAEDGAITWVKQ